ncbi:hypothetical protein I4F81_001591 [Pyropia yezoensis]|uniref:Uncharacterized protein n=1 Tax=Pyropia yezoensis TaxID=2788 RepID=A0ACC3BM43_PYRYE|nr:hypothetical protein I4F81_001591 [Neopyropia yezoensis]
MATPPSFPPSSPAPGATPGPQVAAGAPGDTRSPPPPPPQRVHPASVAPPRLTRPRARPRHHGRRPRRLWRRFCWNILSFSPQASRRPLDGVHVDGPGAPTGGDWLACRTGRRRFSRARRRAAGAGLDGGLPLYLRSF